MSAHPPIARLSALAALLALAGCGPSEPALLAKAEKGWAPTAFHFDRAEGQRDGARTKASYFFAGPDSAWLELRVTVEVEPEPTLTFGRWYLEEPGREKTGSARTTKLRFLGGQGGPPSIGGDFLLREGSEERYRLVLPPTPIVTTR